MSGNYTNMLKHDQSVQKNKNFNDNRSKEFRLITLSIPTIFSTRCPIETTSIRLWLS